MLDTLVRELEGLVGRKEYTSALAVCEEALAGKLNKVARARILQWKARILVSQTGQWSGPALVCLKSALGLVDGHPDEHGRVLNNFAAAYAAIGSVAQCREYRDAFFDLHKAHKSPLLDQFYPSVEFNFGLACHQVELLGPAEEAYLLARAGYLSLGDPTYNSHVAWVELNLIDIFQETDQHEEAYRLLPNVEKVLPDTVIGATVRLRRALYALYKGDHAAALLQVESGLGHPSCEERTRGALLLAKAKILKSKGHLGAAHAYAEEAMLVAATARSSHLCHRVCKFIESLSRGE